jgi:hypothetical protein
MSTALLEAPSEEKLEDHRNIVHLWCRACKPDNYACGKPRDPHPWTPIDQKDQKCVVCLDLEKAWLDIHLPHIEDLIQKEIDGST